MTGSTIDPDAVTPQRDRETGAGHGTRALGPSDTSDSGSDVVGGPGLGVAAESIGLDRGTNDDENIGQGPGAADAGADLGDLELDSDSDSHGTGERVGAGREQTLRPDGDRSTDRVVGPAEAGVDDDEDDGNHGY
jgi:hypothetical protein